MKGKIPLRYIGEEPLFVFVYGPVIFKSCHHFKDPIFSVMCFIGHVIFLFFSYLLTVMREAFVIFPLPSHSLDAIRTSCLKTKNLSPA